MENTEAFGLRHPMSKKTRKGVLKKLDNRVKIDRNTLVTFSYSYSDRLEIALDFIRSGAVLVLGEGSLKRYKLH